MFYVFFSSLEPKAQMSFFHHLSIIQEPQDQVGTWTKLFEYGTPLPIFLSGDLLICDSDTQDYHHGLLSD